MINFVEDPMKFEDEKYLVAPLTLTSYASFVVRLFMYICKKKGRGYNLVIAISVTITALRIII